MTGASSGLGAHFAHILARSGAEIILCARRPDKLKAVAASIIAEGGVLPHAVSKAGVIQFTKTLALELARHGIRVNTLAPGYFDTELNRDFWAGDAGKALIRRIPQRRLGRLSDLDGPLLLLASKDSAYMTGSVIAVDGGHLVSSL